MTKVIIVTANYFFVPLKKEVFSMSVRAWAAVLVGICLLGASNSYAESLTDWGKVTLYGTGWSADQVRVQTTAPFNSAGCATTTDGYVTVPGTPDNKIHEATLLAAFSLEKEVQLVLEGCYGPRPIIIGVTVR
jgi:hypothetical protein